MLRQTRSALFATLPPALTEDLRAQVRCLIEARARHKLVVLDDDPTGTQCVHDIPVLTTWDVGSLRRELADPGPCFFLLTNSRSLPACAASDLLVTIARNLREAAWRNAGFAEEPADSRRLCSPAFTVVSRSDSTLRGHFPLETDVLAAELGPFDATILAPYFDDGGRYTVDDIHYVAEGDDLVPAAETPFARDPAFAYRSSNLRDYIAEKSDHRVQPRAVESFSIAEMRTAAGTRRPGGILIQKLLDLRDGRFAVVNACVPADMDCFALATIEAESAGGRYLYRTAAQFVASRLGLEPRPFWRPDPTANPVDSGGLIVVGSHVPRTTSQLRQLLTAFDAAGDPQSALVPVEVSVREILEGRTSTPRVASRIDEGLSTGRDVVVFTSRELMTGPDAAASLTIGSRVSAALVGIVQELKVRPRFLIAKGGITSSDIATRALGIRRAWVAGRLLPGVPVWETGAETRFPGMPYVVFPGNVGGPEALVEAVKALGAGKRRPA